MFLLALTGVSSATAAPAYTSDPDVAAALDRLATTGQLSDSDRKTLLEYPDLADQVADPAGGTSSVTTTPDTARAAEIGAQGCWIVNHHHRAVTLLGNTFYKFHHRADWCENGSNVLGVHYRNHSWTEVSSAARVDPNLVEDNVTPSPAWEVKSKRKGKVQNCVWDGCFSETTPWVEHTMRGNGSWYPADGEN